MNVQAIIDRSLVDKAWMQALQPDKVSADDNASLAAGTADLLSGRRLISVKFILNTDVRPTSLMIINALASGTFWVLNASPEIV